MSEVSRIVFGEADPKDYMDPLCEKCGHGLTEHEGTDDGYEPCWHGWSEDDKRPDAVGGDGPTGCVCTDYVGREAPKFR